MPRSNLLKNLASSSSEHEHVPSFSSMHLSALKATSLMFDFPLGSLISYVVRLPSNWFLVKISQFFVSSMEEALGLNLGGRDLNIFCTTTLSLISYPTDIMIFTTSVTLKKNATISSSSFILIFQNEFYVLVV